MNTLYDQEPGAKTRPGRNEIELFGGGYLDLLDPDRSVIRLGDIAHALSQVARYAGHTRSFYSVAQHAVEVAARLERVGASTGVCLAGLHHDDSEAYLGDVSRPLKRLLPDYVEIEARVSEVVREALGLEGLPFDDPAVKEADDWALSVEAYHLLSSRGVPWAPFKVRSDTEFPSCLSPPPAERQFLELHETLAAKMGMGTFRCASEDAGRGGARCKSVCQTCRELWTDEVVVGPPIVEDDLMPPAEQWKRVWSGVGKK